MIESVSIANLATYGCDPQLLGPLSTFNYIFGANGSGKTTISRVIADAAAHPGCSVTWKNHNPLESLVYNLDFIEQNFNQSQELKGVFTLGQQNIETLRNIEEARRAAQSHQIKIETLNRSLQGGDGTDGKTGELAELEENFKTKCWAQKQKHDEVLFGAFEGYRNNSEKFKARVLEEKARNVSACVDHDDLHRRAKTLFGGTPSLKTSVVVVDFDVLLNRESAPILRKKIIGKEDVDIAAMIRKLGNSDWVKQGLTFYEANGGVCPFCQQPTPAAFSRSLADYFDETFIQDTQALKDLMDEYSRRSDEVVKQVTQVIASAPEELDVEKVKAEHRLLEAALRANNERIAQKSREPSRVVQIETLQEIKERTLALIEEANCAIRAHNSMVNELPAQRAKLTKDVWKYITDVELKQDFEDYEKAKANIEKAIKSLKEQICSEEQARSAQIDRMRQLEKQTTSIQPTIDEINSLLIAFGFRGFSLAKASNGISYKLVRVNGEDAKETLSEGERSFVAFLYFYHLTRGSHSQSGMTTERVVVFDDPVSSLDSDVLFVVGSLIKQLLKQVRDNTCFVKQVFVLTHNIYFHREITFNPRRCNDSAMAEETFWIVRKSDAESTLERFECNPIKTSYELLWEEVRNPTRASISLQNTLRRILESYFRLLGGIDPERICLMFEGNERLICNSLFAWVNAGSHAIHEDLYVSADDSAREAYLDVFRGIFEKQRQIAHYNMMMGQEAQPEPDA